MTDRTDRRTWFAQLTGVLLAPVAAVAMPVHSFGKEPATRVERIRGWWHCLGSQASVGPGPAVAEGIPMTTAELARLAATPSWPPSCPPLSAVIARSDPSDLPGEMLLRRLGVEIPSLPPGMYGVKLVRLEDGFTSRAWPFEARVTESSPGTFQADTADASPLPSLRDADWLPAECRRI